MSHHSTFSLSRLRFPRLQPRRLVIGAIGDLLDLRLGLTLGLFRLLLDITGGLLGLFLADANGLLCGAGGFLCGKTSVSGRRAAEGRQRLTALFDSLHNALRDGLVDGLDGIFGSLDGSLVQ